VDIEPTLSNVSKLMFIKYEEGGKSKTGIIRIKFNYNTEDHTLNYAGIDYSDNNIQSFIERNPNILKEKYFQTNGELTH
jgi:hypothetical protein